MIIINPFDYLLWFGLSQDAPSNFHSFAGGRLTLGGGATNFCGRFRGLKLWILERLNFQHLGENCRRTSESKKIINNLETGFSIEEGSVSDGSSTSHVLSGKLFSTCFIIIIGNVDFLDFLFFFHCNVVISWLLSLFNVHFSYFYAHFQCWNNFTNLWIFNMMFDREGNFNGVCIFGSDKHIGISQGC